MVLITAHVGNRPHTHIQLGCVATQYMFLASPHHINWIEVISHLSWKISLSSCENITSFDTTATTYSQSNMPDPTRS